MKPCSRCGETKPLSEFYPDKTKRDGHHGVCRECTKSDRKRRYADDPELYKGRMQAWKEKNPHYVRNRMRQRKRDAIELYGGRCTCCGQAGEQFLTFDHVNGDGAEHRKATGEGATVILNWIKKNGYRPDFLQLLCWNCNCARGVHGYCHEET